MALNNYFEIISKEQWQKGEPYRRAFQKTFKKKEYQKVAPKLFDLFRKMNGGKIKKTLVFDFETRKKATLNKNDLNLIQALLEVGYTVDRISYHSGKALKDDKEINIIDILNSLESKIKTKEKMKEVYEKTKNPAIEKQLKFLDDLESFGLITGTKINLRKLSIFSDPNYKLRRVLSSRILSAIKYNFKSSTSMELVGCTIPYARFWLESQLQPGWTWQNYGKEWEIDHIIPCCAFDLSSPEEQKKCFNYKNLRPLSKEENMRKGGRLL